MYPRIRNLREDKDLTQREMGEILSCSQRVYSNYERGEQKIKLRYLLFKHRSFSFKDFPASGMRTW